MLELIIDILKLPEKCVVNKKITKAFFKRNFDLTNAERFLLDDFTSIVSMDWVASISPLTANVPAWQDNEVTYEEIQVIVVSTKPENFTNQASKIIEFIQKYIPYHIVLAIQDGSKTILNVTSKRIHQHDPTKRIMDKKFTTDLIDLNNPLAHHQAFIQSLAFKKLASTDLKSLYESYIKCFVGLTTAQIIGTFEVRPTERTKQDQVIMEQIAHLDKEAAKLMQASQKETQLSKRVALNTQLQRTRKQIDHLKNILSTT